MLARSPLIAQLFEPRSRRPRRHLRRPQQRVAPAERLEERRLLAFDLVAAYADGVEPFFVKGTNPSDLTQAPQQITLRFGPEVKIDPATLAGNVRVLDATSRTDIDVGLTVDDSPNENQVAIRFKETLRDGSYQIVVGAGLGSTSDGDTARPTTLDVRVDLGAFVVSVVPQPVSRDPATGGLAQERGRIVVSFNTEDPLLRSSAQDTSFYRLFKVDPATNSDIGAAISPTVVSYNPAPGQATLFFGDPLKNAAGLYRLEIGGRMVSTPVSFAEGDDNNSSFTTARVLGVMGNAGATITGAIGVRPTLPTPVGDLDFPSPPGALDTPGQRDVPIDSGSHGVPPFAIVDQVTGATAIAYNFRDIIGTDPQGNVLKNVITEAQKQRAREIFELFSLQSGIRFVETPDQGMMVATGDLRAFSPNISAGSVAGLGGGSGALMNSLINWGDSEYGGSWFRVAMHEIGHALGLQHTYDLPAIMGGDLGGEAIFPGDYDFEHLRQLYPTSGSDIDVYTFTLAERGRLTAEIIAARPGTPVDTRLDAVLSLYRQETVNGRIVRTLVARNDDYYGRDPFVGLDLEAGDYFIAVTSVGNTAIDPTISDSGSGGRTDGDYRLDIDFTAASAASNTIVDLSDRPLDGDRDGQAGGMFNFWFKTAAVADTVYVDKSSPQPGSGDGSLANPYKTISAALAAVPAEGIVRIAGTAADPYQIGLRPSNQPLPDGATFNVPEGVTVMIDGGAVFKLRQAVIDVGSSSQLVSRAGAAIQVLGVPATGSFAGSPVTFTSWHDDTIGGDSDGVGPAVQGGQWGGIVFRQDSDAASKQAFVNSISGAVMRYGGGQVAVDSQLESFAPIQIESTRPTVIFNTITDSAGAPIAATPNSFEDTGDRFGPEFRGNRLTDNSINGLFLKIDTEFGRPLDRLDVPARFKSTDIVYVIPENLVINGGVGGYTATVSRLGDLTAGNPQVTGLAKTSDLRVGMQVEIRDPANPGNSALPAGQATIVSIDGPTSITLSAAPVVTAEFATVRFRAQPARFEMTGDATIASSVVTNLPSTAGLTPGMRVEISDPSSSDTTLLPGGFATLAVVVDANTVLLTGATVASRTGARITFIDETPPLGFARDSGRLTIDPGVVVKLQGSRIELERGISQLVAEGAPGKPVIFTSLGDNRYGAGGSFDTNGSVPDKFDDVGRPNGSLTTGDWGGIILNAGSKASIDHAYVAFAGGQTPIEGGFDNFNVIEVHQGDLRLTNSRLEQNAAGLARTLRTGRGDNAESTVFVRGSQPIIIGNDFRSNEGAVISVNANALSDVQRGDVGRSTGGIDRFTGYDDNFGPLVRGNVLQYATAGQAIAGMLVRGGEITVESVWDDTDIVHVLQDEIIVQNFHTATGVRLLSQPAASLVIKLEGQDAGFTAAGEQLDIDDRIGGTVQVVGQPGYPVILTSLRDDSVGASLDPLGRPVTDTNADGDATVPSAGDWRSLRFLPFSNDRNVTIHVEREEAYTSGIEANQSIDTAQDLGILGANFATANNTWESAQEKTGDDNRRLGFEVHGAVAYDDATDVDVYTFLGSAGSEVWIDIDKTSSSLDTMVELLDAAGVVRARSVDGVAEGGVEQGEVVADLLGGTSVTYQFAPAGLAPGAFSIAPGTLSGVISEVVLGAPVAIQTFFVDANGVLSFHSILGYDRLGVPNGVPGPSGSNSHATGGSLNPATGELTLNFSGGGIGASQVEVRYSYQTPALAAIAGIGQILGKDAWRGGDYFTQNPRDAGMRVILPGIQGQQTRYYLRVRSQPRYEPVTTGSDNGGVTATTPTEYRAGVASGAVKNGATSGRYELRVRLRQRDEKPGSTVRYADIRYPTIGIDVQGLPANSPLLADTAENPTDDNNTFDDAQYIGNVLESNRGALSVAGVMANEGDVDWYTFALNYEQLQSIAGVNDGPYAWAGMFDIDYADGFRGDLTSSVFDEDGQLLYVGRDSDVGDDQPGDRQGQDFDDLSRGSAGKLDPFIGTVDLVAGGPTGGGGIETGLPPTPPDPAAQRRYYVAISSNERLPEQLNGTLRSAAANTAVRLEPIASVDRIITDRIGDPTTRYPGVAADERLIDTVNLAAHVTPFTLADVALFVTTGSSLVTVDAMRDAAVPGGGVETTIVTNYGTASTIGDLVMRSDGNLYMYRGVNGDATTAGQLALVDSGTGAAAAIGNDEIKDPIQAQQNNVAPSNTGTVAVTTFQLAGQNLRPPQDAAITGTVRFQREDTTVDPNVTRVGNWTFTATAPAPINGIATLTFTPGAVDGALGRAPVSGTVNLRTGVVSVTWNANVPAADVRLVTVNYEYTFQDIATDAVDAIAWRRAGVGNYQNLVYAVWDPINNESFLYQANPTTGSAAYVNNQNWGLQGTLAAVGGRVTGLTWVGGTLYGVADNGTLFTVTDIDDGNFDLTATPIAAPAFAGVAFAGLALGPANLRGEAVPDADPTNDVPGFFSDKLFAIDAGGALYALDTTGSPLTVFDADGDGVADATSIATGVGGATGLAFSPLDVNLWHPTTRRNAEAGGGTSAADRLSMYFGLEAGTTQFGGSQAWQQDLLSNPAIGNNYNLPGGAYGSLATNPFNLADYAYTDKPTLYFDYWLQTEGRQGTTLDEAMRDSARVLASIDGGLTWELLTTNNSATSAPDTSDGELPNFASVSSKISNDAVIQNQHVQELYDTSNWRQARVDLGKFAGQSDIRLRFDFSTAGMLDPTQQTADIDGDGANDLINDIVNDTTGRYGPPTAGVANRTGNFNSSERGQRNEFEGFYIDDIVIGFAERGEAVSGATAGQTTFFDVGTPGPSDTVAAQVLNGPYQLEIRRGTEVSSVAVPDALAPAPFPETFDTNDRLIPQLSTTTDYGASLGDANQMRDQGQFIIEGNLVSHAAQFGIRIDAAARDGGSNAPHPGTPRNLPTLNNARLAPGVVVRNNILTASGTAGILFSGDPNTGNVPAAAVPFGRIVNNTIYGGETPAGTGVQVTDNAGPTLLNNLFANLARGVAVDGSSASRSVIGTSAYWNTTTQVTGVTQSDQIVLTDDPFVSASTRNFYLAAGSRAIDSSLNSLQDRDGFTNVNSQLGIPPSPILAPDFDLYGQLRSDDPGVTNLSGLGSNVFKDRGAIDRVDFAQPSARLETPVDNSPDDQDPQADRIRLELDAARGITRFLIQLEDVGVGIDPATVTSAAFTLSKDGVPLQDGQDYVFVYFSNSKQVAFDSASVFSPGDYEIRLTQEIVDGNSVNLVRDLAGNALLPNQTDGTTAFTIELDDIPAAPSGLTAESGDGLALLNWLAAASGSPLIRYDVQWATDSGFTAGVQTRTLPPTALGTTAWPLVNGTPYWFRVRATNALGAGNWSTVAGPIVPLNPPDLALAVDSGRLPDDNVTNIARVTVAGLVPGAAWEYSTDGGITWIPGTGTEFILGEGVYPAGVVAARQTLLASTSSIGDAPAVWTIDLTPPEAAGIALADNVTSPVSRSEALQVTGVVSVSGESNALMAVTFSRSTVTLPVKNRIGSGGLSLSADDLTSLGDGLITSTVTQTDLAGNVQASQPELVQFLLDTVAPVAPSITGVISGAGPIANGQSTNDSSPLVYGTAEPGSMVTVLLNGSPLPSMVPVDSFGNWSLTAGPLTDGTYQITTRATDAAGNTGVASIPYSIVVDTLAPAAPVITTVADDVAGLTGVVPDGGTTNDRRPTISGTAASGSTVTVLLNGIAQLTPIVVGGNGAWSFTPVALADGTYAISARATDVAGNTSVASTSYTITIDASAPSSPAITAVTDDREAITGNVANGGRTNDTTPTVSGTAEPGSSVVVRLNGTAASTATVATSEGTWSLPLGPLSDNLFVITAVATDNAGNTSGPSVAYSITIDTVAPTITAFQAASGTYGIGETIAITAMLSEPVRAGGVVEVGLNTGARVVLTAVGNTATATGSYVVRPGESTSGLKATSITASGSNRILDLAGNALVSQALPPDSGNFGGGVRVVVDGSVALLAVPPRFSADPYQVADAGISVTEVPIRFTTPVSGVTLAAFELSLDGRPVSLRNASLSGSGDRYTLRLPALLANPSGVYKLVVRADTGIAAISNGVGMSDPGELYWGKDRSIALTPIETAGSVTLATDIAGKLRANGTLITRGGSPLDYAALRDIGWEPAAAEVDGGRNTLVLKRLSPATPATDKGLLFWRFDANWSWLSGGDWTADGTLAYYDAEVNFGTDFNEDGVIGLEFTPIESAGSVTLATDAAGKLRANGTLITKAGGPLDAAAIRASGWEPAAAEVDGGRNTLVLKQTSSKGLLFWRFDANWSWLSGGDWTADGTPAYYDAEVRFGTDFNEDGVVGLQLTPIESAGSVILATDSARKLRANGRLITKGGNSLDYAALRNAGWEPAAAEVDGGRNTLVLKRLSPATPTTDKGLLFWRFDANWNWLSGGDWTPDLTLAYYDAEVRFGTDFNEDGDIGLGGDPGFPLTPIESTGSVILATDGAGKLRAGLTLITRDGSPLDAAAIRASGWDPVAADVDTDSRNTLVLQRLSDGALLLWRFDANWNWVSGGEFFPTGSVSHAVIKSRFGIA
jgi:hypothetical protein